MSVCRDIYYALSKLENDVRVISLLVTQENGLSWIQKEKKVMIDFVKCGLKLTLQTLFVLVRE